MIKQLLLDMIMSIKQQVNKLINWKRSQTNRDQKLNLLFLQGYYCCVIETNKKF